MEWKKHPAYRERERWELSGRQVWAWRAILAVILIAFLVTGHYVGALIFFVLCIVGELLRLRQAR